MGGDGRESSEEVEEVEMGLKLSITEGRRK